MNPLDEAQAAIANDDCTESPNPPTGSNKPDEVDRRTLIKHLSTIGAVGLATALGGGATLKTLVRAANAQTAQPATTAKQLHRFGMVIDTRRCIGCMACTVACKAENKTPPNITYNIVSQQPAEGTQTDRPLFLSQRCFHCENPPCIEVCTVAATYKRASDGIVVVDYDLCKGLQNCVEACPYGARYYDSGANYPAVSEATPWAQVPAPELKQFRKREKGKKPIDTVRKCTFCLHLQDENGRYDRQAGRWPACAKTCTGHAIHFGDFMDSKDEIVQLLSANKAIRLKEKEGTEPNVYYLI
jgi:molybdopterin-containing oxidoreductase family iron-sulfur binding subunit